MNEPKRVLIISYNYPPVGTIGSIRPAKFAKFLPCFGWYPTILTVSRDTTWNWARIDNPVGLNPDVKTIRAYFPNIRNTIKGMLSGIVRIKGEGREAESGSSCLGKCTSADFADTRKNLQYCLRWIDRLISFPDVFVLWFPFALLRGLLETMLTKYDVILSTSPPETDHLIAASISKLANVPWVAEFRDPWSQNEFKIQELPPRRLRLEQITEKKVISRASAIITYTEALANDLRALHGEKPKGIHCIYSGFDPDDYPQGVPEITERFIITYTGMLYGFKRDPTMLIEVIEELISDGKIGPEDIRVRFYGPPEPKLEALKDSLEHPQIVEIHAAVTRSESIRKQLESTALLIIQWSNPYTSKLYGGKVFEHLGAKRPIIAITNREGLLRDLIARTNAGYACSDKAELKAALNEMLEEFYKTGMLGYNGIDSEIAKYSWYNSAKALAAILDEICS